MSDTPTPPAEDATGDAAGERPGITITRIVEAPPARVFEAWTDPAQFAEWFGTREAEIPLETVSMDVRPGGSWSATMYAGPDRHEIPWKGTYLEIEPPTRLVFTLTDQPGDDAEAVTVTFDDLDNMTEMTFYQRGGALTDEEYAGARQGWLNFFDTLAEIVVRD